MSILLHKIQNNMMYNNPRRCLPSTNLGGHDTTETSICWQMYKSWEFTWNLNYNKVKQTTSTTKLKPQKSTNSVQILHRTQIWQVLFNFPYQTSHINVTTPLTHTALHNPSLPQAAIHDSKESISLQLSSFYFESKSITLQTWVKKTRLT